MTFLNVWVVNQYASTPDRPGLTRNYALASLMSDLGVHSTLIGSSRDYLTRQDVTGQKQRMRTTELEDGVRFVWLKTSRYTGNGAARIYNMLAFSVATLRGVWWVQGSEIHRPDVVVGSSPHLFGAFAAWALSRRYHVPFVLEIRDIHPKSVVMLMGVSPRHPYVLLQSWLEKFLYGQAELLISPLQGAGEHARSVTKSAPICLWVPNGVDVQSIPAPTRLMDREEFTVMYTGAHGVAHSLNTALDAAKILQELDNSIRFVFVGDGVEKLHLEQQARRLGLHNVEFRHPVAKTEIPALLATADACLFLLKDTPLYDDGLSPNKIYDYFSAGRPVIMATSSRHDPVAAAGAGITVEPENPRALAEGVVHLKQEPREVRQAMADNGRSYVELNHDLRSIAENLAAALHDVSDERSRARHP